MHELHLPLILLGLCLLLLLALPEMRQRFRRGRGNASLPEHERQAAATGDQARDGEDSEGDDGGAAATPAQGDAGSDAGRQKAAEAEGLLLLHLMAEQGKSWSIGQVAAALQAAGLSHGKMDIFHYPDPAENGATLFSIANVREPGTLNPADLQTPGIDGLVVFRRLSGDARDARAWASMLRTSKVCCEKLDATLCDEQMQAVAKTDLRQLHKRFINAPGGVRDH